MQKQKSILVIRNSDKKVYRRFRQKAVEEDINVGKAITEAMEYWLEAKQNKKKTNISGIRKLNGIIKAGKKVRWSEQVDEILYGASA
jgi:hypothetical protein